jgi:UDP-N-acetylmuramoylalanine--D-glutamate ligase
MQREKICAVLGLARTGIPAARFLAERGAQVVGYDDRELNQLSEEARDLQNLGVELRVGANHNFRGLEECSLIVLSPGLKIHHSPLKEVLERCEQKRIEIIGELEMAARHCPAPIIAVTGTKGKSTTVKLIEEILRACGVDAVRCGNTGTPLIAELPRLSPQSWAVVEASSFQLEKTPTFKPRVAVLLNLLADHQDYHTSLEQYWNAKMNLFAHQGKGDTAIFNFDDPQVVKYRHQNVERSNASWCATSGARNFQRLSDALGLYVCNYKGQIGFPDLVEFEPIIDVTDVPLIGEHNLSNVAAAIAAVEAVLADEFIQHREAVVDTIRNFESLPHRLENVATVNGVTFINDSQGTIPEAAIKALHAFEQPVTLIAGGRAKLKNDDAFDELGKAIAQRAHLFISIGEAASRLEEAARRAGFADDKIRSAGTLENAIRIASQETPSGGTVVMSPACASFDQFASYEVRGEKFRELVKSLM